MAVSYLTTDSLIETIKRKAMIPANQVTFTTADFLAFANEEMDIGIVPLILTMHEEYYVHTEEVPLEANKSHYSIPYRAIGGKIRDIFYKDTGGNLVEMTRIQPEDKAVYQSESANTGFMLFYLEGNNIVIVPGVGENPTGNFAISYYLRPNDLVEESRVATITSMATVGSSTVFTVDSVPTGFSTSTDLDILQTKSGHKTYVFDVNPTSVNSVSKLITFDTDDISSDIQVGDYISFAGESIIPQMPSDLHNLLAQRVAARCLEATGDREGLAAANAKISESEVKATTLIDNRTEGAPQKIINHNGLLRSSRFRRF